MGRDRRKVVLLAGGLLLFGGCKKGENNPIPTWYAKNAAAYYYDLDSAGISRQNFTILEVTQRSTGHLKLREEVQLPTRFHYSSLIDFPQDDFYKHKEGLYCTYTKSCDVGIFSHPSYDYQLTPANPAIGQQMPLYACSEIPYGADTVATVNETITVPAGTFKAFSIAHFNGDRSWWEQGTGLIQYQTFMLVDTGKKYLRVTLKLSQIRDL